MKKFIFSFKVWLIAALVLAVYNINSGYLSAQDTTPIPPAEVIVFSFYDTQLKVVCYMATAGIYCLPEKNLSQYSKDFIKDRVMKYRKDIKSGNRIPRIVPLDK